MRLQRNAFYSTFSIFCFLLISTFSLLFSKPVTDSLKVAAFEYPQIYQNTADRGIALDIVYAAFNAAGIKVEFEFFPVARMISNVVNGTMICGIGGTVLFDGTAERSEVYILDTIQYVLQVFLYDSRKHPEDITFDKLSDMKDYRIGALFASGINKYLEREKLLRLELNTTHDGSVKQLEMGRIDLWAIVDITGMWYINKYFPTEITYFKYTRPFMRGDICAVFSKKLDPDSLYGKAFKQGLTSIKTNGTYLKIMAKYYGGNEKISREALTNDLQNLNKK